MDMLQMFFFYFIFFFSYAILGWIMEVIVCGIPEKKFVNRGFLIGPYCPIYGIAALLMWGTLEKYINDLPILFIVVFVFGTILEYSTSYLMEKIFKARWWDYSDKKFNINGRACLGNSVCFGVLGCIIMNITNPIFISLIEKIPYTGLVIVGPILFIIFMVDIIISCSIISKIRINITTLTKDSTEEITEKVRELLKKRSILHKRLVNAFPDLKAIIKEKSKEIVNEKVLPKIEKIRKSENKQK